MPIDLDGLKGKVFSPAEAAQILGVTPDSVRRLVRERKLGAVHPFGGTTYLIHGDALIRYVRGLPPKDTPKHMEGGE
ncbi:MAG: helix-turn-helix domain-containing protein [Acidobacteriota bacterium]